MSEWGNPFRRAAQDLARHSHQVADHSHAGGKRAGALAVVKAVAAVLTADPDRVVGAAHARQNCVLGDERRAHREDQTLRRLPGGRDEPDGVIELVGVLEIDGRDPADALGVNVGRGDLLAESERRQDGQLGAGVLAVDVGARIGLGVAQALRLGEHFLEVRAAALDLGEDVVRGSVEDAVERADAVARNPFTQHGVDGDAAGHAGLHGQVDAAGDGPLPDLGACQRHELLVGGDHGLAVCDGGFDDLARDGGSAHELSHDVHIGMSDHVVPVARALHRTQSFGQDLGFRIPATDDLDAQVEAELEPDLLGVLGEDGKRPASDVAEADNADIHIRHKPLS